jgi:uncharacterized membrane protein YeaQ/YmgE (transglycosylase-associated protein family)
MICLSALFCCAGSGYAQSSTPSAGERLGAAAESTKATLQQAGTAAANEIDDLWRRVDESRLKHRTRDEVVAWVIVGLLVGNLVCLFTAMGSTVSQRFGTVVLGLVGAFIGGVITHVCRLNFGMGPLLIRYEDLLVSVIGGFVLLAIVRIVIAQKRKRALVRASKAIAKP